MSPFWHPAGPQHPSIDVSCGTSVNSGASNQNGRSSIGEKLAQFRIFAIEAKSQLRVPLRNNF